jgi:hypothetical protein
MQPRHRHHFLAAALGAIAQLHPAATLATQSEKAAEIIAAQLRRQGVACTAPRSAVRDPDNSAPHEAVWTLRCDEASYRVTLLSHLGARIVPMCQEDHRETPHGPERHGDK